ncbi:hypothetical protein [Sphaerisporangium rhizosphaerae]|uniref:Uncharacterized protein n=1 Tax=Sphaerisporangium rhizosphaerae TaxID=2269375 RepID=A0ABW2P7L1_9ACTN
MTLLTSVVAAVAGNGFEILELGGLALAVAVAGSSRGAARVAAPMLDAESAGGGRLRPGRQGTPMLAVTTCSVVVTSAIVVLDQDLEDRWRRHRAECRP